MALHPLPVGAQVKPNRTVNTLMLLTGSGLDTVGRSGARTWRRTLRNSFSLVSQSLTLRGRPHRSSLTFAMPRAHGRVPAMASDDELQHSGSATLTGPLVRRLPSIMSPPTPLWYRSFPFSSPFPPYPNPPFSTAIGQPFLFLSCIYHQAPQHQRPGYHPR